MHPRRAGEIGPRLEYLCRTTDAHLIPDVPVDPDGRHDQATATVGEQGQRRDARVLGRQHPAVRGAMETRLNAHRVVVARQMAVRRDATAARAAGTNRAATEMTAVEADQPNAILERRVSKTVSVHGGTTLPDPGLMGRLAVDQAVATGCHRDA